MTEECDPETIGCDAPCVSCGYDLRGLRRDGKCPECGDDIANSDYDGLLRYADPAWVSELNLGAMSVDGMPVVLLLLLLMSLASPSKDHDWRIVALCAGILAVLGVRSLRSLARGLRRLTIPEPGANERMPSEGIRWAVRWGWAPTVALSTALLVAAFFQHATVICVLGAAPILAWLIVIVQYCGRLSDRLPSPSIRRRAHYCSAGMIAGLVFVGFMAYTSRGLVHVNGVRDIPVYVGAPLLFGGIAMMWFLHRFSHEIGEARTQAWQNADRRRPTLESRRSAT